MRLLLLLAVLGQWAVGQEFAKTVSLPAILMECAHDDASGAPWWKVKNCKIAEGATLDDVINNQAERADQVGHCGQYGPWIQDQNGNVMYRRRNPPCPKNPPKGPKNYDICDLRAIGMQGLPESATPRTLSNPSEPRPWTDGELKEFCKSKGPK